MTTPAPPADWTALVAQLADRTRPAFRSGAPWRAQANAELIPAALDETGSPEAFLLWARDHRMWSLTVAESVREVCGKPREVAIYVLGAIVEEVLEDEADGIEAG